jgi:L-histidine Nalpha-methyltransferase
MIGHDRIRIDVRVAPDELRRQLREDVRRGLTEQPKRLPPKWHYDEAGSRLFDEITRQPEYYPTGREREILTARVDEIARLSGAETLIELGSGTGEKTRLLLTALTRAGGLRRFVPFDVSEEVLRESAVAILEAYPGIEVCGIVGDFEHHLDGLPLAGRALAAFLGGTIGNLRRQERAGLLDALAESLREGDLLLLGADLVKPRERLEAAYNDAAGVSSRFSLNVLAVLNRELGADFDPSRFRHNAVWDEAEECMDIGIVSLCAQRVTIADLGIAVEFAEGEKLHTQISAKFRPERLTAELTAAGFDPVRFWTDEAGEFSLSLSSRVTGRGPAPARR